MTSQEFKAHMNFCNHGENEGKCIFDDSDCPRLKQVQPKFDEGKFEGWLEYSYWQFDAARAQRKVSERDNYKMQMRMLKNAIIAGDFVK